MRGSAVHCCPSTPEIREAFGLVAVEAKEAGIPSVVFRSGAMPELVGHKIDGWVCDEVSGAALAEGIEYFITDIDRTSSAGKAAHLSLQRFSREKFASGWLDVFEICATVETLLLPDVNQR
jgi:glycosyltransferase involved in cell wall biosynthesis